VCSSNRFVQDISEVKQYLIQTKYGQQASIFSSDAEEIPQICDFLAHHVTRINLNAQCQRGPDSMPFSGRKG
jgi:glyceraldehyde-3-phosphate dehydrogenase (NADP+)